MCYPVQVEPIEVLLRLESSSKWPDELEAVRSTGTAFLIRLAQCLEKKVHSEDWIILVVFLLFSAHSCQSFPRHSAPRNLGKKYVQS